MKKLMAIVLLLGAASVGSTATAGWWGCNDCETRNVSWNSCNDCETYSSWEICPSCSMCSNC